MATSVEGVVDDDGRACVSADDIEQCVHSALGTVDDVVLEDETPVGDLEY